MEDDGNARVGRIRGSGFLRGCGHCPCGNEPRVHGAPAACRVHSGNSHALYARS